MRTTLILDDGKMADLMKETGQKTKTRAVTTAIDEYLKARKIEAAIAVLGTLHFDRDWKQMKADERAAMRRKEQLWKRLGRGRS